MNVNYVVIELHQHASEVEVMNVYHESFQLWKQPHGINACGNSSRMRKRTTTHHESSSDTSRVLRQTFRTTSSGPSGLEIFHRTY